MSDGVYIMREEGREGVYLLLYLFRCIMEVLQGPFGRVQNHRGAHEARVYVGDMDGPGLQLLSQTLQK